MESAPIRGRTTGDAEYVAGVSLPLVLGGRLSAARRAGEADREGRLAEARARALEVEARVRAAFAAVLYAEEAARLRAEIAGAGERGVAIVRSLLSAGDALPGDVARSELELVRDRLEVERAEGLRERAGAALAAAVGDSSLRVESVVGSLEESLEVPALESLASRLAEHPAVLAAQSAVSAEEARLRIAEAERIPDVDLDLFYRRIGDSSENAFDVGVAVDIPILDRRQGRVREAAAAIDAAQARAAGLRNELGGRLRALHADLARALAAARVLRDEILPRAAEVLRAAEARLAAGDIRLGEILSVRRDATRARLDHLESLRAAREAWAALAPFVRKAES
jgi:cobalt-zinc-cadmium efflux system outer membrane protein